MDKPCSQTSSQKLESTPNQTGSPVSSNSQYAHIASKLYGFRLSKQFDNNGQSASRQIFRKKSSTGQILDLSMFLLFITGILFFIFVCPYADHLTLTTRKNVKCCTRVHTLKKWFSLDESLGLTLPPISKNVQHVLTALASIV